MNYIFKRAGTSPGIFFLSLERLSSNWRSLVWMKSLVGALLHSFRCASIRVVRRSEQGLFVTPSPPPHGDPGAAATCSSLSSNLPGAGPRRKSSARTSPSGGLHEELSYKGHTKRRHCRPRRHREDATGVVVTLHRGNDAAVGQSCGTQPHHALGRRRNRAKNFHSNGAGLCGMASYSDRTIGFFGQSQNQFHRSSRLLHLHYGNESLAHCRGRRAHRG